MVVENVDELQLFEEMAWYCIVWALTVLTVGLGYRLGEQGE